MIVSGVLLKANLARIVTLTGTRKDHQLIADKFNKLELAKNPTQEDVEVFIQAFKTHCVKNSIDMIIINRRITSGQRAGGAGTFIKEGILLATSPAPLDFIHSTTIRATDRKESELKTAIPKTADLIKAYDLAFEGLE